MSTQTTDDDRAPDGQCAFFLAKKKRFCRFRPSKDQKYCAEHATALGVEMERRRIQCPLNPKHSCYEDALAKHLKKCNSKKRKMEEYYEEGINAGSDEDETGSDTQKAIRETDTKRLLELIDRVNKAYKEHIGTVETDVKSHECLKEELHNLTYGLPALRHRRQQASLIGQLDSLGLLAPGHCFVEMGAGKGKLSHWVREAISSHNDASFLLVDRNSIRYKVDGLHKEEEAVPFERIQIDIEHLSLDKVPLIKQSNRPVVAIGKHLCGAATDLTLRCLVGTLGNIHSDSDEPLSKRPCQALGLSANERLEQRGLRETRSAEDDHLKDDFNSRLVGLVIALCCHHQCRWQAYVGKSFLRHCGISAADFDLLTRLSSWAVCGWRGLDSSSATDPQAEQGVHEKGREEAEQIHSGSTDDKCQGSDGNKDNGSQQHNVVKTAADDTPYESKCSKQVDEMGQHLTVGATCDNLQESQEAEHKTEDLIKYACKGTVSLSEREKETVGWRCKRLIDYGRVRYLEEHGMSSVIKEYVDKHQTPENVALVAVFHPCKNSQ